MTKKRNHHDLSAGPILLAIGAVFLFTSLDGIAKELGKIATVGLAPAVFGPLMNVTG